MPESVNVLLMTLKFYSTSYCSLQPSLTLRTITVLLGLLKAHSHACDSETNKRDTALLTAQALALREEVCASEGTSLGSDGDRSVPPASGGEEEEGKGVLLLTGLHQRLARTRSLLNHRQVRGNERERVEGQEEGVKVYI